MSDDATMPDSRIAPSPEGRGEPDAMRLLTQLVDEVQGLRRDLRRQTADLLTLPEAADYLRIGQRTLDRIIAHGGITPANVGDRRLVVRKADLVQYVHRQIHDRAN